MPKEVIHLIDKKSRINKMISNITIALKECDDNDRYSKLWDERIEMKENIEKIEKQIEKIYPDNI